MIPCHSSPVAIELVDRLLPGSLGLSRHASRQLPFDRQATFTAWWLGQALAQQVDKVEAERGPIGFSVRQAATALGVSTGSIRRWSDQGRLETTRTPGGQRRFSQEQIDRFIGSLSPTQIPTRGGEETPGFP
jgi:excisionase family DNA binding protein